MVKNAERCRPTKSVLKQKKVADRPLFYKGAFMQLLIAARKNAVRTFL